MLYEAKVSYTTRDDEGREVLKKESYVVENCVLFANVEERLYGVFDYSTIKGFDVTDIKRSRIKELANRREMDEQKLFMAEVQDVFTTDDGQEKPIKYKVLFFAEDIARAMSFINEYITQGYDMTLVSLKETKFKDVL